MTELSFRNVIVPPPTIEGSVLGHWWRTVDRWTLGALIVLIAAGMVLGLAASPPLAEKNGLWTYHYVVRQTLFTVMGLGGVIVLSLATPGTIRRLGVLVFLVSFLGIVLLPWLGTDFGKGAVRWYSLGLMSLQPSEFLKPGFVLVSAWLMSGSFVRGGPPGRTLSGIIAGGLALLLALQPDFGQAILILCTWGAMLFLSGASVFLLAIFGGLVGAGAIAAYYNSDHFAGRINGYLAGDVSPNTQLAYAQAAIREGGFFGVGAAQGQVKWTLPDAHTDFIIAVAAEEFGLILTICLIGLYLFITIRALIRLSAERDPFIRLGGAGLAITLGLQAFVNFSVAIRLLPAKGMTLPFVSYGGSSMMAAALGMGALLALTRTRSHTAHLS